MTDVIIKGHDIFRKQVSHTSDDLKSDMQLVDDKQVNCAGLDNEDLVLLRTLADRLLEYKRITKKE